MRRCDESDCDAEAAVELHIPWDDSRVVCPGHARVLAREAGVVAHPLDDADDAWP